MESPRSAIAVRPRAVLSFAWALAAALGLGRPLVHAEAAPGQTESVPGETVTVVDPIDIPPEHDPLAHAWDIPGQRSGFYLRASTSIGVQNDRFGPSGWDSGIEERTVTGFGSGFGLQVGGMLRPWLALHVDTSIGVLWNGDVDELQVLGDGSGSARVVAYGLAPAATFFTRHDFYFTPALGLGFATLDWPYVDESTNVGFYMNLVAGKDVYKAQNFSVGLQFQVIYMLLGHNEEDYEARIRQFLFGASIGFDSGR